MRSTRSKHSVTRGIGFQCGGVVQLVRTPACHAGGRGFESRRFCHLSGWPLFVPKSCSAPRYHDFRSARHRPACLTNLSLAKYDTIAIATAFDSLVASKGPSNSPRSAHRRRAVRSRTSAVRHSMSYATKSCLRRTSQTRRVVTYFATLCGATHCTTR